MSALMTAAECATRYRVSVWTIYNHAQAGMPHTRFGNRMLFDPEKVDAYLADRERERQQRRGAASTTAVVG